MAHLFQKINGQYFAEVPCPDCGILHLVSHKNYYAQKSGKRNLSFRCATCGQKRAAKTRRNPNLRKKTSHGYIKIYQPENPMADKRGEVYEHRLIMSEILGRPLKRHEHVHHKNADRADNRPANLELFPRSDHGTIKDLQARIRLLEDLLAQHEIVIPL